MRTNIEKFRHYEAILNNAGDEFCKSLFPQGFPDSIYKISVNYVKHAQGYFIQKADVEKVVYFFKDEYRIPWFDRRPTREQVEKVKSLAERVDEIPFSEENVFFHVRDGNTSWASSLTEFSEGRAAFSEKALEERLKELIETYVPQEGQFKCKYCGKATDNDKKHVGTIIARQYPNFRAQFDYCSKQCAGYDQMGHEG